MEDKAIIALFFERQEKAIEAVQQQILGLKREQMEQTLPYDADD